MGVVNITRLGVSGWMSDDLTRSFKGSFKGSFKETKEDAACVMQTSVREPSNCLLPFGTLQYPSVPFSTHLHQIKAWLLSLQIMPS